MSKYISYGKKQIKQIWQLINNTKKIKKLAGLVTECKTRSMTSKHQQNPLNS